jgi:hypothetical protein
MKAVMIATDFLKDTDGSFKILELNTNVGNVTTNISNYFDIESFNEFIVSNGIEVIEFINQSFGGTDGYFDAEINTIGNATGSLSFPEMLNNYYTGSSVSVTMHILETTSNTVPFIEDAPNKLILRNAYDTTALIDDTYAKDNFEFLKLMYDTDSNSIPKTYFVNTELGFDTIGEDIRDNNGRPNFIVKERYPTTNYNQYPKVYKIDTTEELSNLKSSLPANTLLQEYILNEDDLLLNRTKTYRSVDIIYGSDLEVRNLFTPYVHTNSTILSDTTDFDENGELQWWERPIYLQKVLNKSSDVLLKDYKVDETSKILMGDGSLGNISDIEVGDVLKSIHLNNLGWDDESGPIYTASMEDVVVGNTILNTSVTEKESLGTVEFWLKEITLDDGTVFLDIDNTTILAMSTKVENENVFRFTQIRLIDVGDSIAVVNTNTNELEIKVVSNIQYTYGRESIYKLEVEESDLYLTMEEESNPPLYALIQHNNFGCGGFCCQGTYYCNAPCGGYSYSGWVNGGVCCGTGWNEFGCSGWSGNWCEQAPCGGKSIA